MNKKHKADRVTGYAINSLPAGTKAVIVSVSNDDVVGYLGELVMMAETPEGDKHVTSLTSGSSWSTIQVALNFDLVLIK